MWISKKKYEAMVDALVAQAKDIRELLGRVQVLEGAEPTFTISYEDRTNLGGLFDLRTKRHKLPIGDAIKRLATAVGYEFTYQGGTEGEVVLAKRAPKKVLVRKAPAKKATVSLAPKAAKARAMAKKDAMKRAPNK